MTTHWRIPTTCVVQHCGFDFSVPNASIDFRDYGVLWERDRIVSNFGLSNRLSAEQTAVR
jgi:hypothetical protein